MPGSNLAEIMCDEVKTSTDIIQNINPFTADPVKALHFAILV